jgi:phage protein D
VPKVNEDLGAVLLPHIDQNESDANLITRIADEHDAIATVKMAIYCLCLKVQERPLKAIHYLKYSSPDQMVIHTVILTPMVQTMYQA